MFKRITIALAIFAFTITFIGEAKAVTILAHDAGWWRSDGASNNNDASGVNSSTLTGFCCGGSEFHSFYVFDLSSESGTVTAATFRATLGTLSPSSQTETFTAYDYTGSINSLTTQLSGGASIFNDLGGGNSYGSITVTSSNLGNTVSFNFNAQGLTDLTAALGGNFAFGGDTTATSGDDFLQLDQIFQSGFELDLTISEVVVPEPSVLLLLGFGLLGLGFVAKRFSVTRTEC